MDTFPSKKRIERRDARAEAYSFSQMQIALECGVDNLKKYMQEWPPFAHEKLGVRRAGNGAEVAHYTPAYVGRLRLLMTKDPQVIAMLQDTAKRGSLGLWTYSQLNATEYVSKAELLKRLQAAGEKMNLFDFERIFQLNPPYPDEIDSTTTRNRFAVRYITRVMCVRRYNTEFRQPKSPFEKNRDAAIHTLATVLKKIHLPLNATSSQRIGVQRITAQLNEYIRYLKEDVKNQEDLDAPWFKLELEQCLMKANTLT